MSIVSCRDWISFSILRFQNSWHDETRNHCYEGNEVVPDGHDDYSKELVDEVADLVVPGPVLPEIDVDVLWNAVVDVALRVFSVVRHKLAGVDFLYLLTSDSVSLDLESGVERRGGLVHQEILVDISLSDDLLVLSVEKSAVEEVVKVCNDGKGQEVHHNIDVSGVGDQSHVVDRLDDQNHGCLQEPREPCQKHAAIIIELPWVVSRILHEIAALLEFSLQKYMQDYTAHKTRCDDHRGLWERVPALCSEYLEQHKNAKTHLHHVKDQHTAQKRGLAHTSALSFVLRENLFSTNIVLELSWICDFGLVFFVDGCLGDFLL